MSNLQTSSADAESESSPPSLLFVLHLLLPLGLRSLCLSVQLGQLLLLDEQLLVDNPLLGLPLQVPLYSRVELGSVLNLNIVNTQITNCKLLLTLQ